MKLSATETLWEPLTEPRPRSSRKSALLWPLWSVADSTWSAHRMGEVEGSVSAQKLGWHTCVGVVFLVLAVG